MAKKLVYNYRFTPGVSNVGTIAVPGNHPLKTLLLITNVTDNQVIFNFADPEFGGTTTYDSQEDETLITLAYDTSSMDESDALQIFVDIQEERIDFSETFIDPVSKLRVSEPQNLIDTDFEYGLQPTKWETVELVNNIPSFFANDSNYTIPDITSVTTINGSSIITVTTRSPHQLSVGTPIDVQGLSSRTAEGKFLITSVPTETSFTYTGKSTQPLSGTVNGSYTSITPGEFYSGSDVIFRDDTGIETDEGERSSLTIGTNYDHGFKAGTSVYLTNTIGSEQINITSVTSSTAPDGRPVIDPADESTLVLNTNSSFTETKQMTGTYALKFSSSSVNTATDTITWPSHGLSVGDVLLYVPPAGDTEIGGLQRFQIYYVKTTTTDTITLCATTSGDYINNAQINITSQGTSNFGRHQLILGYELIEAQKSRRQTFANWRTRFTVTGSGSGSDRTAANNYYGLGGSAPDKVMFVARGTSFSSSFLDAPYYSTTLNTNFGFNKSGTIPDGYDFIEDFERFNLSNYANSTTITNFDAQNLTVNTSVRHGNNNTTTSYNADTYYVFFLNFDNERDTLYFQNHGLNGSGILQVTTTSGSNIVYRTESIADYNTTPTTASYSSGSTTDYTVISADRIKLNDITRLDQASGTYSISLSAKNTTRNSVYVPNLTLPDRKILRVSAGSGGALPTTSTGAVDPEIDSIKSVYSATIQALNTVRTGMGTDAGLLLYNGTTDASPFGTSETFNGGIQDFRLNRTQLNVTRTIGGSSQTVSGALNTTNGWASGVFWDPFASTVIGRQGYYYINTPFATNSATNYHIDIIQIPNITLLEGGLQTVSVTYSSGTSTHGLLSGTRDAINNNYTSWTSLSDGWRYTFDTNYFAPTVSAHGLINMILIIDNTNWSGYFQNWSNDINFATSTSILPVFGGQGGQRYHVHVLIPVQSGAAGGNYGVSGSTYTNAAIASIIANQIKTTLTNPSFGVGINTVYSRIIGSNRLSFETIDSVPYNFTGFGTAPINIVVPESTGALDGYYEFTGIANTTAKIFTNATIPKRELTFVGTDIVGFGDNNYINIGEHKLKTGQIVTYSEISGGIDLLTPGGNYYAISDGPNYLRLSTSLVDAHNGVSIGIGSTSSGSFLLESSSISGISSAQGSVAISTESKTVLGSGALFKRYYKEGDLLKIENTLVSPPRYQEYEIASIIDDNQLTIKESPGIGITNAYYYIDTKVNVRPDGTFVHRPFDGGVEITAGTSPNSSIVRQTRKYFRYQSGKGIQCSLAINFNPSRLALSLNGYNTSIITSNTYDVNVYNQDSSAYIVSGTDRDGLVLGNNGTITIYRGDTINFIANASGHPLWIKTTPVTGTGDSVTTGVTNNGDDIGTISWDTTGILTGTYYYQCQNHGSMYGEIVILPVPAPSASNSMVNLTTAYPHGIRRGRSITVKGANDSSYNGTFEVVASDDFNVQYITDTKISNSTPGGIIEYNVDSWSNSAVRAGLFDYQNGFFYEFDGGVLYAVRRSSVQQLAGTVNVSNRSNIVLGNNTRFIGQLNVGEFVVIRGTSYRITAIKSNTELNIQPSYRGIDAANAIITKTVDTKVPQNEWNIDIADGNGPSGFLLDITKIQMCYLDYSWYGAGKIRFGFKDTYGHVKYVHEFIHNNRIEEAYMRSGNIPGRYEIDNYGDNLPSYVPSLFHWGTSIIMDGRFDDDKAYLFTAPSNTLSFTNGDNNTINTTANSSLYEVDRTGSDDDWYVRIPIASADAVSVSVGSKLYTTLGELNGEVVSFITYSGSTAFLYIYIQSSRNAPISFPFVPSGTALFVGAPPVVVEADVVDLTKEIPVISIRLAPSVDNNLTGEVGAREIINRMQLQLKSLGITLSHDCNVDLILNGSISNKNFENVDTPSLSQLVKHVAGDRIDGGTKIFSLRASGGTENAAGRRLSSTTDFDLTAITDLGNAILGGDGTFPNGPDILTIAIRPIDTGEINADTPLAISSRITWTESQA